MPERIPTAVDRAIQAIIETTPRTYAPLGGFAKVANGRRSLTVTDNYPMPIFDIGSNFMALAAKRAKRLSDDEPQREFRQELIGLVRLAPKEARDAGWLREAAKEDLDFAVVRTVDPDGPVNHIVVPLGPIAERPSMRDALILQRDEPETLFGSSEHDQIIWRGQFLNRKLPRWAEDVEVEVMTDGTRGAASVTLSAPADGAALTVIAGSTGYIRWSSESRLEGCARSRDEWRGFRQDASIRFTPPTLEVSAALKTAERNAGPNFGGTSR